MEQDYARPKTPEEMALVETARYAQARTDELAVARTALRAAEARVRMEELLTAGAWTAHRVLLNREEPDAD
jgi:hypothetical protein